MIILIVRIVEDIYLRNLKRGKKMDKKECENILKEIGFSTARSEDHASALLMAIQKRKLEKPMKKKTIKKILETKDITEPKNIYRREAGGGR